MTQIKRRFRVYLFTPYEITENERNDSERPPPPRHPDIDAGRGPQSESAQNNKRQACVCLDKEN